MTNRLPPENPDEDGLVEHNGKTYGPTALDAYYQLRDEFVANSIAEAEKDPDYLAAKNDFINNHEEAMNRIRRQIEIRLNPPQSNN